MITERQLSFQTPDDVDHQWGETYWLGFYVPEANLYGWVYLVFRAGSGAVMCDVEFIDRCSREMFDAGYIDIQNHLVIPADLREFTLANGLSFSSHSPRSFPAGLRRGRRHRTAPGPGPRGHPRAVRHPRPGHRPDGAS